LLLLLNVVMLSREAANTHFIVFGFTRSGLKSMIYRTRGEHTKTITPSMLTLINEALHSHYVCTKYGQNPLKDVDSRVFTRMLRKDGRKEGRTVALLYPFATSLARG
jgi:hypothetical protein